MNLIYKYVNFIVKIMKATSILKLYLYYQTHVMNFHFWIPLLVLYFVKNLIAFNTTL